MPATVKAIIQAATAEWTYWGNSTWNVATGKQGLGSKDDNPAFAKYVIDKYCAIVGDTPTIKAIQNDDYAWSAVGMSYFMKTAGFTKSEFPFANNHSRYIRHFIAARRSKNANAAYWGYRMSEPKLVIEVGDLVGYGRDAGTTQAKANKLFDRASAYQSHTDVVVAVRSGEIDVIGANVMDSVTKKTLKLGKDGRINDPSHFWFVLLKARL